MIKALGHSIAFDCLMNNWDRFPALSVWPRKEILKMSSFRRTAERVAANMKWYSLTIV